MKFSIQRTSFWNRIAAALLDFILIMIVIVGIGTLVSLITGYNEYEKIISDAQTKYETQYNVKFDEVSKYNENETVVMAKRALYESKNGGVKFDITPEEYEKLTTEEKPSYVGTDYKADYEKMLEGLESDAEYVKAFDVVNRYDQASHAFNNDKDVIYASSMTLNLMLIILSLGFFGGYLIIDFIIPLIFKNGQTIGKKIFGIAVMHPNGVRINAQYIFIRTFLGKFVLETMIPVLLLLMFYFAHNAVAIIVIGLIAILEIVLLIGTECRQPIHDLLAKTVTVDIKSQRFFDNDEEYAKFVAEQAAEEARRSKYF